MARIVTPTTGTPISASTFGVPLRNDYVSQTDTSDQTIASNLVFASGKRLTYQGGALPFVTVGATAGCDYVTDGTADDVQTQLAMDNLTSGRTWQETVKIISPTVIADTLLVPAYTRLQIEAPISLANGVNADMIRNENYGASIDIGITIEGVGGGYAEATGALQGNSANNTTSSLIALDKVNYCTIQNLDVADAKVNGLSIANATLAKIHNNRIRNFGGCGIKIDTVVDSWFDRLNCYYGTGENWYSHALSASTISNLYLGGSSSAVDGQLYSWSDNLNLWSNIRVDNSAVEAIYLTNSYQNQFNNVLLTSGPATPDNTKSALRITGAYGFRNIFHNTHIYSAIDNHKWLVGVEEINSADKNYHVGLITQTSKVSTRISKGANSKDDVGYDY
jgi:hypothetical protein